MALPLATPSRLLLFCDHTVLNSITPSSNLQDWPCADVSIQNRSKPRRPHKFAKFSPPESPSHTLTPTNTPTCSPRCLRLCCSPLEPAEFPPFAIPSKPSAS